MTLGLVGIGLVAALAAAWGVVERGARTREAGAAASARRELESALAAARQALEGHRAQLLASQSALREARTGEEALRARLAQVEQALGEREAQVLRADGVLARMRRGVSELRAESQSERQRLEQHLEAVQGERDGARRELELAWADRQQLRRELDQAAAERQRLAAALEEARLAELEREELRTERGALASRVEAAEAALARARQDAGRSPSREFFARMEELDQRARTLQAELDTYARRAQSAEAELARRDAEPAERGASAEREALRQKVEVLEESLRRLARARASLRVLGLPGAPRDGNLFAPERRNTTEAVLRDTYLAAQASAASLIDARGVSWGRCGNLPMIERLGATAAILSRAPVAPALGQTAHLVSEAYGVYGRHFIALHGPGLWLGVSASRECPALALRLAALQLVGSADPRPPEPVAALTELDPAFSDRLDAWVTRRGAQAAALFGPGQPAATDSAFAAACAPLVAVVRALHLRAARDHFAAGFQVIWRGEDDTCLVARLVEEAEAVAFARFGSPPSPRTLDDLVATVRWSAQIAIAS